MIVSRVHIFQLNNNFSGSTGFLSSTSEYVVRRNIKVSLCTNTDVGGLLSKQISDIVYVRVP
jgi:hypothetical protein